MGLFGPPDVDKLKAKGDVPGLIGALGYEKDKRIRLTAAYALSQIPDARAIEPLVAALRGGLDMRMAAACALGAIGAPAIDPLVAALRDPAGDVREGAADALGRTGDPRAVEPLMAALHDQGPHVREAASLALAGIGAPAIDALVAALRDKDRNVRDSAVRLLGQLGWSPDIGEAGAAYHAARQEWDKCVAIGAAAVGPLVDVLQTGDRGVRDAVVGALGQLGWNPDDSLAGAIYCAARREWDRCVAIGAAAVGPLALVLEHPDWETRKAAAGALVAIYRSGRLDEASRQRVLERRDAIKASHADAFNHADDAQARSNDCAHEDCTNHTDEGIGLAFPV